MGRYDFLLKKDEKPTTPPPPEAASTRMDSLSAELEAGKASPSPLREGAYFKGQPKKEPEAKVEPHPFAERMTKAQPRETLEPRNLGTLETRKEGGQNSKRGFDLAEHPYRNNTYSFTQDELDKLEDIKLDLKRNLDMRTSMNEIIRAALHILFDDYDKNGERSSVVKRIKEKGRR